MKNLLILSLIFTTFSSFSYDNKRENLQMYASEISWYMEVYDFGEIPQKKAVSIDFSFTNTGDAPLVITDVKTSCGCTATNYPKTAIAPGETSQITVEYNAKALGAFSKAITVVTNATEQTKLLRIKGTVVNNKL